MLLIWVLIFVAPLLLFTWIVFWDFAGDGQNYREFLLQVIWIPGIQPENNFKWKIADKWPVYFSSLIFLLEFCC